MATKTITIDLEAYRRLRQVRRNEESFSQTIKRLIQPAPKVASWLERVGRIEFSPEFVEAVEEQIVSRSQPSRRTRLSRPKLPIIVE